MVTPLRSGQSHMSVGDSAEEFILIHALRRERLLVLSCGLPSKKIRSKFCFSPVGRRREFLSEFFTHQPPNVFLQKPDRRPPQITGRRVSAVHQGGVEAPNELATLSVHDAVVDFVERSVLRTRNCAASNPRSA